MSFVNALIATMAFFLATVSCQTGSSQNVEPAKEIGNGKIERPTWIDSPPQSNDQFLFITVSSKDQNASVAESNLGKVALGQLNSLFPKIDQQKLTDTDKKSLDLYNESIRKLVKGEMTSVNGIKVKETYNTKTEKFFEFYALLQISKSELEIEKNRRFQIGKDSKNPGLVIKTLTNADNLLSQKKPVEALKVIVGGLKALFDDNANKNEQGQVDRLTSKARSILDKMELVLSANPNKELITLQVEAKYAGEIAIETLKFNFDQTTAQGLAQTANLVDSSGRYSFNLSAPQKAGEYTSVVTLDLGGLSSDLSSLKMPELFSDLIGRLNDVKASAKYIIAKPISTVPMAIIVADVFEKNAFSRTTNIAQTSLQNQFTGQGFKLKTTALGVGFLQGKEDSDIAVTVKGTIAKQVPRLMYGRMVVDSISGSGASFTGAFHCEIKVINTENGEIIASANLKVEASGTTKNEAQKNGFEALAEQIASKIGSELP